ncbi:hypothetical protein [Agarivorans aestuarii]|uniref:hypothetical protein n=1 Tax=Agarivorans aestuarii TaxID=1563703 RepID=UPI001C80D42A|nr:hypothetical protein [Agarivorans aestuarii]
MSSQDVVVRERVTLDIELQSLHPFAKDLTLPYVDIEGVVVLNDKQPVTSSVRSIGNQKWYTQKTRMFLFPTLAETYVLPTLSINTAITPQNGKVLEGRVNSLPIEFKVKAIGLNSTEASSLVVGKKASLSLQRDREAGEELEIGDAITFTYKLDVAGSDTVVLPEIKIDVPNGTEVYRKPAEKENILNPLSKTNNAVVEQRFTIIFQEPGSVIVPAVQIPWWDTDTQTLKELVVEKQIVVTGDSRVLNLASSGVSKFFDSAFAWFRVNGYAEVILFFSSGTILWLLFKFGALAYLASNSKRRAQRRSRKRLFLSHIDSQAYSKAIQVLYLIVSAERRDINVVSLHLDSESKKIWERLLEAAYDNEQICDVSIMEAGILLNRVMYPVTTKSTGFQFNWRLNPQK